MEVQTQNYVKLQSLNKECYIAAMKTKTKNAKDELIPVSTFSETYYNRRGFPISLSYIYRLIKQHKAGERKSLPFRYKEIGQKIFIVKD